MLSSVSRSMHMAFFFIDMTDRPTSMQPWSFPFFSCAKTTLLACVCERMIPPIFTQEHGLSIGEQDLLISCSGFVTLLDLFLSEFCNQWNARCGDDKRNCPTLVVPYGWLQESQRSKASEREKSWSCVQHTVWVQVQCIEWHNRKIWMWNQ